MIVLATALVAAPAALVSLQPGQLGNSSSPRTAKDPAGHRVPVTVAERVAVHPLPFARKSVKAMFSYDSRAPRDSWRSELLATLATTDGSPGSQDIDRMIPDEAQWVQMAAIDQRSSAMIADAYVPSLWTQTRREHPELPPGAKGITVIGSQLVTWEGGTSRVPLAVTVLLLCPPATERCLVNRITAQVAT